MMIFMYYGGLVVKKLFFKMSILFIPLFTISVLIIVIDPYFHFHNPLPGISYIIDNERYQNAGILRRYNYDALITGTSMEENIKVSEVDQLFGVNSVKAPYGGAYFPEISNGIRLAYDTGHKLKIVIMSIGHYQCNEKWDYWGNGDFNYPCYMYDDNIFNDGAYLFNVGALKHVVFDLYNTTKNIPSMSMDEYGNWGNHLHNKFGKEAILAQYERPEKSTEVKLSSNDMKVIRENLAKNIISLANKHKDTKFYLYFPPYSVVYWDKEIRKGRYDYVFSETKFVIEELLGGHHNNIKIFYFPTDIEITTNLDNYIDYIHYGDWVNSYIIKAMSRGYNLLTKENYLEYIKKAKSFYADYNYESIFN